MIKTKLRIGLACVVALTMTSIAKADDIADFYKGKTVNIIVGAAAGGAYDLVSRTLANHMSRYIPGNPKIIVSNMVGASSLPMVNFLTNAGRKDGTVIGMSNSNIALERPLKMLSKNGGNVAFDVSKLQWIGSPLQQPHVLWVWHQSPAKTFEDLKTHKTLVGSIGVGGDNYALPTMLNYLLGTKLEIISGYEGQSDVFVAAERGEIEGNSAVLPNLTSAKPEWFRDKKVRVLVQFGTTRMRELPDVPTAIELATNPFDAQMLRFYALKFSMAYPLVMAPDVPPARVQAMRDAFDATVKDEAFLADAKRLGLDVNPFSGLQMHQLIEEIDAAPKEVVDRVAQIIAAPSKP